MNWLLVFIYATGPVIGAEASAHVSEETKDASKTAPRGIMTAALISGFCGFACTILFLFVTPPLEIWYTFSSPQPFVEVRLSVFYLS